MLNRFTHDYLETLAACDFAPKPKVSGRLASYDGLLMEAIGLSLPGRHRLPRGGPGRGGGDRLP